MTEHMHVFSTHAYVHVCAYIFLCRPLDGRRRIRVRTCRVSRSRLRSRRTRILACVCAYMLVCVYVCMYVCTHVYIYICTHSGVYVSSYLCIHAYVCVHMGILKCPYSVKHREHELTVRAAAVFLRQCPLPLYTCLTYTCGIRRPPNCCRLRKRLASFLALLCDCHHTLRNKRMYCSC